MPIRSLLPVLNRDGLFHPADCEAAANSTSITNLPEQGSLAVCIYWWKTAQDRTVQVGDGGGRVQNKPRMLGGFMQTR